MRRIGALFGALTLTMTLAGCWEQAGYNAGKSYWNSGETDLSSATIGDAVELWTYDIGDEPATNLLSANGKVFAAGDTWNSHKLVGINASTGALIWTYVPTNHDPDFPLDPTNVVFRDGILESLWSAGSFGGDERVNADTGAEISRTGGPGRYGNTDLAVVDGVLVNRGSGAHPGGGGDVSWVRGRCDALLTDGLGGPAFAFLYNDLMWSHGTQALGYIDCDTGFASPTWTTELGGTPIAVAAVGTDRVVYIDDTGTMTLLDAATGATVWDTEVGTSASRPAVVDGTIFLASADNRLVAYSAATGDQAWDAALGAPGGAPVAGGDVVYTVVGSDILAFDAGGCGAATCTPIATLPFGGEAAGGPIVDDGRLVVGTTDGRVVAFGLPG